MSVQSLALRAGVLLLAASWAGAQQLRGTLDLGSSSVRYADSIDVAALTMSPAFQLALPRASLGGFGTLSQASGSSTYSGTIHGDVTSAPRRVSGELGASAGGSAHNDGSRTGQMMGTGRLYLNATRGGGWAGAGLGRTWDGLLWRAVVQGSLGGWLSTAAGSGVVGISPTTVDDSITYTDATASFQRSMGRLELGAMIGNRFGEPVPTLVTDRLWGNVSATAWVRPGMGFVASAGTYPIDFTQGYPGGRFLSVALRLSAPRAPTSEARAPAAPVSDDLAVFEARPGSGGATIVRVRAPAARSVEITGDFTNWQPVALAADGNGWWSTSRVIAAGAHEINVRRDGGAWRVPPGLVVLRDEFGGNTGLLVIPERR